MRIEWILCPICSNKTRERMREDTVLKNFPLFCPKCKKETLINVEQMNITIIKEPDAQTQSLISKTLHKILFVFSSVYLAGCGSVLKAAAKQADSY